jgi:hypothetical protein
MRYLELALLYPESVTSMAELLERCKIIVIFLTSWCELILVTESGFIAAMRICISRFSEVPPRFPGGLILCCWGLSVRVSRNSWAVGDFRFTGVFL